MANAEQETKIFNHDYRKNINKILRYRKTHLGKHSVDPILAKNWINSQLTERRRRAAQNFINNIHYFTLDHLFEQTKNVIIKLYADIGFDTQKYFWVGPNKKSSYYFMGMVGLYAIRRLGYPEPFFMWDYDPSRDQDIIGNSPVIILDDCSYSGNQIGELAREFLELGQQSPLYLCTAFATEYSLARYSDMAVTDENSRSLLHSLTGQIVPNLVTSFDRLEDYLDIRYYFSPFTEDMQPVAIIYFDHKMAVENSTYMRALTLGPVLPGDLGYPDEEMHVYVDSYFGQTLSPQSIAQYLKDLQEDNEKVRGIGKLKTNPFINGCEKYYDLSELPYSSLMYSFNEFYSLEFEDYRHILNRLKSCPTSFYKELF